MYAKSRNGREMRPQPASDTQVPAAPLSAAFRTALGAIPQTSHLEHPAQAGKRAAGMSKADRKDRTAPKAVTAKPPAPRSGHR